MPPADKIVRSGSTIQQILDSVRQAHNLAPSVAAAEPVVAGKRRRIVDIMTFCYGANYLNLPNIRLNLWIGQRVILKTFYMGSSGNENIKLTDEEWNWLYVKEQHNVIRRLKAKLDGVDEGKPQKFVFDELNLCLGRRASKTVMTSIIAAYEAYKLIELGDPYEYYNIPEDEEIAIINVSNSQDQSNRLFSQIEARIRNAPFFRGRVDGEPTASKIRLLTDVDIRKRGEGLNIKVKGSIVMVCGHSNPDTLMGFSAAALLFDELAFYDELEKTSGKDFYNKLKPSISKFAVKGDGRVVEISAPGYTRGIFYELHREGQSDNPDFKSLLSFRLATWDINEDLPYECDFLAKQRAKDMDEFNHWYGAMWVSHGSMATYFTPDVLKKAFRPYVAPHIRMQSGFQYFIHVDPASTRDNYALVVVARTPYVNARSEKRWKVHMAFHKIWTPGSDGLDFKAIDEEVIQICRRFRALSVTYDTWNSSQSLATLRTRGVNATQLSFSRGNKALYYQHLEDLMNRDELFLYPDELVYGELANLKYRPTARGVSVNKDPKSDIPTDDVADCLVGAAWMASGREIRYGLPRSIVVDIGRR